MRLCSCQRLADSRSSLALIEVGLFSSVSFGSVGAIACERASQWAQGEPADSATQTALDALELAALTSLSSRANS